jgi:excisionase family DNA binding protein
MGLISVREVADRLGYSTVHVRNLILDGKIKGAVKVGNQYVVPEESVRFLTPKEK